MFVAPVINKKIAIRSKDMQYCHGKNVELSKWTIFAVMPRPAAERPTDVLSLQE